MSKSKPKRVKIIPRGGISIVYNEAMKQIAQGAKARLEKLGVISVAFQELKIKRFLCGEVKTQLLETVRGKSVFLFFGFTRERFNDDLITLFLTLDTLDNAGCSDVTLVVPFFPYTRQDRKDGPRTPLSAAKMIKMLATSKSLNRVITLDMHAAQLESAFSVANIQVDHLPGSILVSKWIMEELGGSLDDLVIVAPDVGSGKRARKLEQSITHGKPVAIFDKERTEHGTTTGPVTGASIEGKICFLNDDMMDSCGTIIGAATSLLAHGARKIILSATHPIFSAAGGSTALEKLEQAGVHVIVTNTLETEEKDWLTVLPTATLLADVIFANITFDGSVSKIINGGD